MVSRAEGQLGHKYIQNTVWRKKIRDSGQSCLTILDDSTTMFLVPNNPFLKSGWSKDVLHSSEYKGNHGKSKGLILITQGRHS